MAPTAPTQVRPGGRSARVRAAVHRAVTELLAERPAEPLTIPLIAARAGVHPTTVYRRWPSLGELLADVAASRFTDDVLAPDTGSLRTDLERWTAEVARDLADPDVRSLLRATIGTGGSGSGEVCVANRHEQLAAMLERERSRGGDPPGLERTADALLGPLYYRALFAAHPADSGWPGDLVAALLGP